MKRMIWTAALSMLLGGVALAKGPDDQTTNNGANAESRTMICKRDMASSLQSVQVQNTRDGVVIKMQAKSPDQTLEVQRLGRALVDCLGDVPRDNR